MLPFPALTARRQTIIVVVQRYAPATVRAAVTSFSRFFTNVVHVSLLPDHSLKDNEFTDETLQVLVNAYSGDCEQ